MRSTKVSFASNKNLLSIFIAGILALSLCLAVPVNSADADVRKADIILGETADSRGLSVAQCPNVEAEYAVVTDTEGTLYFERNATAPVKIASITKIMTAIVAIENASPDTVFSVSARAAAVGESSASLQEGDVLTYDAVLKGLMLSSGNDAAIAIAETIGGILSGGTASGEEAERIFVDKMNEKASELGLTDTYFTNPHGLDHDFYQQGQHSCAIDIVKMAQHAMQYDEFRSVVSTAAETIPTIRPDGSSGSLYLESTNVLLTSYEGNAGIKTGYTIDAGYCFAGVCIRDGKEIYTVVLKTNDSSIRFNDTISLCNWYYEHNVSYPLAHSSQTTSMNYNGETSEVPVIAEVGHADWIDRSIKATLADPFQEVTVFDLNGNISQTVEYDTVGGNVSVGDKLGTVTFKQRNDVIATVDLIACEEVAAPDFFEGIGIWWDRLFKGFSGEKTVADNVLINETPLVNVKETIS